MFYTMLKAGLRAIRRQPFTSMINIIGLTFGVAACLLFALYLNFEWSYDGFHTHADQIYRVNQSRVQSDGDTEVGGGVADLLADEALEAIPGAISAVRYTDGPGLLRHQNSLYDESLFYADPGFFTLFDFPLKWGDQSTALDGREKMVISTALSIRLFGEGNPLGRMVQVRIGDDFEPFTVSGVMEELPANSHFAGDVVLPFQVQAEAIARMYGGGWGSVYSETFLLLESGTDPFDAEQALNAHLKAIGITDLNTFGTLSFSLQPLTDLHIMLSNPRNFPVEASASGSIILALIALVILLTACINFTALATGQATVRSREVGVRKVLGANRGQIIRHFWLETALLTGMAILIALGSVELILPLFNRLAESSLSIRPSLPGLGMVFALWGITVLLAGTYPALQLSGFSPVHAFRGESKLGGKNALRRSLVLIQFTLSITLVAATVVMMLQLRYMRIRDLGYDGEQLVVLEYPNQDESGMELVEKLRFDLGGDPGIVSMTGSSCSFSIPWVTHSWSSGPGLMHEIFQNTIGPEFDDVLQLDMAAGRFFDPANTSDRTSALVVNEALVEYFQIDQPIGADLPGDTPRGQQIVGVVKNFHFSSLHEPIKPLVMTLKPYNPPASSSNSRSWNLPTIQRVLIRLQPDNIPATMNHIERTWQELVPEAPFEASFVDEQIDSLYQQDRRWGTIVATAAGLAFFLAVMGMIGLVSLHVGQRTREIGIRKALGASTRQILTLLGKEITLLVIGANLLALPLGWWLMKRWLENFAYHLPHTLPFQVAAGVGVLLLSWAAVLLFTWRTASSNPTDALRHE
ncbi:ABC transporter permease [bacterium]|nr:ABC transporter permease [bacterium]